MEHLRVKSFSQNTFYLVGVITTKTAEGEKSRPFLRSFKGKNASDEGAISKLKKELGEGKATFKDTKVCTTKEEAEKYKASLSEKK